MSRRGDQICRVSHVLLAITLCHCSRDVPCLQEVGVVTVGETIRARVGTQVDSDCRTDLELSGFTFVPGADLGTLPWEARAPRVEVGADGALRGLAPGRFKVLARKGKATVETSGVVLPVGWTMKLVPEDATIVVGDAQPFAVHACDAAGKRLPGLSFTIFAALAPDILRGPGLVSSTESVTYTARLPGKIVMTGYLGRKVARTTLTVVPKVSAGTSDARDRPR